MKTLVAVALIVLAGVLALDSARHSAEPVENYGYQPPTNEDRQLFGSDQERTLSKAAPHLFEDAK